MPGVELIGDHVAVVYGLLSSAPPDGDDLPPPWKGRLKKGARTVFVAIPITEPGGR